MTRNFRYLYGPVPSRRLGRSLGIDLVPSKICTYDCVYCQIGRATVKTLLRKEYIPKEDVLDEVKAFLLEKNSSFDHFSLSGSGEPTLHSEIRFIIEGIKSLSSVPVAVITNGSLLYDEKVREDLLRADIVLPSLDAVSAEIFTKINQPHPAISAERVIEGMVEFRKAYKGKIWLEILFCKGVNDSREELERMKTAVERIQPDLIHLNTVVRPPSEEWANPLNQEEMERIRTFFGGKASIISEFNRHFDLPSEKGLKEKVVEILRRRPLSLTDLSTGMGISEKELEDCINLLLAEGEIRVRQFGNSVYYEIPS